MRTIPGEIIGYRKDGRPVRLQAGGAYNACVPEAVDLGLAAWTMDPATTIVSTALATTVIYLASVYYKPEFDLPPLPANIFVPNGIVGTSTAFQVGLYNQDPIGNLPAGTLLASSPGAGTIAAGLNKFVLTYTAAGLALGALPQGRYWIALLNTTGTTTTGVAAGNPGAAGLGANVGTDTNHMRFATNGTGATLPATIAPASNVAAGAGLCLCAALG